MGDYRNELQSALSQVEALRTENAALRMRLRAAESGAPRADAPDAPPPVESPAPPRPRRSRRVAVGVGVVAGWGALLGAATLARREPRAPPEERLMLPDLPVAPPERAESGPLPLPATSVTLPPRARPEPSVDEVRDPYLLQDPVWIEPRRAVALRWPSDDRLGLYVLHTTPAARCSVGGVIFDAPSAVFVTAGTHPVRCQVGRVRHTWEARIAARQVTFDTQHDVGSR